MSNATDRMAEDAGEAARVLAEDAADVAAECTRGVVRKVQEHPCCALSAAFLVGMAIGMCLRR